MKYTYLFIKDAMWATILLSALLAVFAHPGYIAMVCIISLTLSGVAVHRSTSSWLFDLLIGYYRGEVIRTATGYRFGLHDVVVTSSDGPIYHGFLCIDGRSIHSTLTSMDLTLFMELIGDTE